MLHAADVLIHRESKPAAALSTGGSARGSCGELCSTRRSRRRCPGCRSPARPGLRSSDRCAPRSGAARQALSGRLKSRPSRRTGSWSAATERHQRAQDHRHPAAQPWRHPVVLRAIDGGRRRAPRLPPARWRPPWPPRCPARRGEINRRSAWDRHRPPVSRETWRGPRPAEGRLYDQQAVFASCSRGHADHERQPKIALVP